VKKRDKAVVSINLRLPADLHRKLVEEAASRSPVTSLNSEILSRLFESFARPGLTQLEKKLDEMAADTNARVEALQTRAEKATQQMQKALLQVRELERRVEGKLK
jgi:hypothetical protein